MPVFAIAPSSLHRLRRRLDTSGDGVAAEILHHAGYSTGEALHQQWRNRIAARTGLDDAGRLDLRWFGPLLDELCIDLGWGSLAVTPIGNEALLIESGNWAEAEQGATARPACHFSCGAFAAFLSVQAGGPIAVIEVECRSSGDDACRFLAGSTAALAAVHDLVAAERPWRDAYLPELLPG